MTTGPTSNQPGVAATGACEFGAVDGLAAVARRPNVTPKRQALALLFGPSEAEIAH